MIYRLQARVLSNWAAMRAQPERGDTVEKILWVSVIIGVVGVVGGMFRDAIVDYFDSIVFTVGK
jgi:hypothetical protein